MCVCVRAYVFRITYQSDHLYDVHICGCIKKVLLCFVFLCIMFCVCVYVCASVLRVGISLDVFGIDGLVHACVLSWSMCKCVCVCVHACVLSWCVCVCASVSCVGRR